MADQHFWPVLIGTIVSVVSVTVAVVTLIIGIKKSAREKKLTHYIAITQRVFEVDQIFIANPELRVFFYESHFVEPSQNVELITAVTEYILDFYSTIQEHERFLTDDNIPSWGEWTNYIKDGFRDSPFLCYYVNKNRDWYEDGLLHIYENSTRDIQDVIHKQTVLLESNVDQS